MSNDFDLTAENRSDTGKGASRRLRRLQNKVPGIIYGGNAEPAMISLEMRELKKAMENPSFYSQVLVVNLNGKNQQTVLRDLQRSPASGFPIHLDFLRVAADQKITMVVPIHFLNEEECVGVKQQGGEVYRNFADVEIICLPSNLPEFLAVDLAEMELGQVLHLSDIPLPDGVEIPQLALGEDHNQALVAVHEMKVRASDEEDEAAGEEDGKAAPQEGDDEPSSEA